MSFRSLLLLAPAAATFVWAVGSGGCSASDTNTFDTTSAGTNTGSGPGSGGSGGTGTNSGGSSNDGGGGGLNLGGNSGQGGFSEDASCAAASADAELIPLDMIILLDQSGSMGGAKWTGSVNAINTFVNDPASAGISVGLQYFPLPDTCNQLAYQNLDVPIGELPQNASLISTSLAAHGPSGGTPMYPALQGVLFVATAHQDLNPTRKVIVVLATDGVPGSCPPYDIPSIAGLASSAFNYNGVQTFAIAIQGSNVASLDQIASAGGTVAAYDVTSDVTAFAAKMNEIRTSALACEYLIPEPPPGQMLDINKVAVKFTDSNGISVQIPKADNAVDCGNAPGWYYDNPASPTKILLCPATCTAVQAEQQGKVNVLFGCEPDLN